MYWIIATINFFNARVTNKHTMNRSRREFVQIRTRILDKAHTIKNLRRTREKRLLWKKKIVRYISMDRRRQSVNKMTCSENYIHP